MDITCDDPVAATIGDDICEDVVIVMGVAMTKGEDVYAHCISDTSVDWSGKVVP